MCSRFFLPGRIGRKTPRRRVDLGISTKGWRQAIVETLAARALLTGIITEYSVGGQELPQEMAVGTDRGLWFTEPTASKVGRFDPATGTITKYTVSISFSGPQEMTSGPDGNIWFTEAGANKIGRIDLNTKVITDYSVPTRFSEPYGITTGPDGNIWFTELQGNKIGRLDPLTGQISEYSVPTADSQTYEIEPGPDGALWFTEQKAGQLGRIDPTTGQVTEIPIPTSNGNPGEIVVGPDSALWFTELKGNRIGRYDPATKQFTEIPVSSTFTQPVEITDGVDGNLWFTENTANQIGRINPTSLQITTFAIPTSNSGAFEITSGPDGNIYFTEITAGNIGQVAVSPAPPGAPQLSAQSDTGISDHDRITRDNGSAQAPLTFQVTDSSLPDGVVQLYDYTNPASPVALGLPVQATGGTATITLSGTPLGDGVHNIAATVAVAPGAMPSGPSAPTSITIETSLTVTGTNPADNSYVPTLPNGQVVVTFGHPLAGLIDGQTPIQNNAPLNPYDVFLLARGPGGFFSAPSGIDQGNLPLHANVIYHVNPNGTSEFVITPTEPLSTDVYAVSLDLGAFSDLAGNPLTDSHNPAGYRTFLLQLPPVTSQPLKVIGVTEFNGFASLSGTLAQPASVFQPDTIAIKFNKPLYAGAAGNNNVQLMANSQVIPAVAAYSPSTDSIYLTPTTNLNSGTEYEISVSSAVSDDQGFGGPDSAGALGQTFKDVFILKNAPAGPGQSPFQVATNASGVPQILPIPASLASSGGWNLPVGYASVQFAEPLNFSAQTMGRYAVMLVPQKGGLNNSGFDSADVPLNTTLAFNPNTNQLVIVPSQPVGSDVYLYSLGNLQATNGDPLLNSAGQPAGTVGPPYFATFGLTAQGLASAAVLQVSAEGEAATTVILPAPGVAVPLRSRGPVVVPIVDPLQRPSLKKRISSPAGAPRLPYGPLWKSDAAKQEQAAHRKKK